MITTMPAIPATRMQPSVRLSLLTLDDPDRSAPRPAGVRRHRNRAGEAEVLPRHRPRPHLPRAPADHLARPPDRLDRAAGATAQGEHPPRAQGRRPRARPGV